MERGETTVDVVRTVEFHVGEVPAVLGAGQQPDRCVQPSVRGGDPQPEQGGAAAEVERAVVGVLVRHATQRIAVQLDDVRARPAHELPGLRVVHGRCRDGVLDQRRHE